MTRRKIKKILILVAFILNGASLSVRAGEFDHLPDPDKCPIIISFGSFCCGTDRDTDRRIGAFLKGRADLAHVLIRRREREGEHDLCVKPKNTAETDALYEDLKALMPAHGKKGWTRIRHFDGRSFMSRPLKQ